jgi:hypothetical protein
LQRLFLMGLFLWRYEGSVWFLCWIILLANVDSRFVFALGIYWFGFEARAVGRDIVGWRFLGAMGVIMMGDVLEGFSSDETC